jgi:hypothetical protein
MSTNTTNYDAPERAGLDLYLPVAASTKLYAGNLAALNASGYLVAAADAANLRVIGRVENDVDNSAGSNGDLSVKVHRGVFRYDNSGSNAVTAASIGKKVYIEDDHTISTSAGTNKIVAGRCVDVDSAGVWVDTRLANAGALPAATQLAVATTGSSNSSPYGYTTSAQADAIVAALNAARTDIAAILTYLGL